MAVLVAKGFNNQNPFGGNNGFGAPQQPANNNAFGGNDGGVFDQNNSVDLGSLPFGNDSSDADNGQVNIDDQSAMSTDQKKPSSDQDDQGDHPSIDDVPF